MSTHSIGSAWLDKAPSGMRDDYLILETLIAILDLLNHRWKSLSYDSR